MIEYDASQKDEHGNIGRTPSVVSETLQTAVNSVSFMAINDIHEKEMTILKRRKYCMHIMMSLIALGLVFGYCYYYSEVCVHRDYYN